MARLSCFGSFWFWRAFHDEDSRSFLWEWMMFPRDAAGCLVSLYGSSGLCGLVFVFCLLANSSTIDDDDDNDVDCLGLVPFHGLVSDSTLGGWLLRMLLDDDDKSLLPISGPSVGVWVLQIWHVGLGQALLVHSESTRVISSLCASFRMQA